MKMVKKVREYKSGDFIFAKVKGYPAWPARVQRQNGKKYFVYFYGTSEIANLPPNMIFDYAENKEKFLSKSVKRKDFNDGVRQIEHDFANNVPLEEVVGILQQGAASASVHDTTMDDTAANSTLDDSAMDTTTTEDSTVVDTKGRKSKAAEPKTPSTTKVKEPKTPRGRQKKEETRGDEEEERKAEELVSRSGRKIRPKRYIDEHTGDNATLPIAKKRRGASPPADKDKGKEKEKEKIADKEKEKAPEKEKERDKDSSDKSEKLTKHYNAVTAAEIEDLKEPFKPGKAHMVASLCSVALSDIHHFEKKKEKVQITRQHGKKKFKTH